MAGSGSVSAMPSASRSSSAAISVGRLARRRGRRRRRVRAVRARLLDQRREHSRRWGAGSSQRLLAVFRFKRDACGSVQLERERGARRMVDLSVRPEHGYPLATHHPPLRAWSGRTARRRGIRTSAEPQYVDADQRQARGHRSRQQRQRFPTHRTSHPIEVREHDRPPEQYSCRVPSSVRGLPPSPVPSPRRHRLRG